MSTTGNLAWVLAAIAAWSVSGCGGGDGTAAASDGDTDADGDADTDTDGDADADADSDGDTDGDADADADSDTDSDTDADGDGDTDTGPECTVDTDCPGVNRGCFLGICRDKCMPLLNPCNWKPSGNVCVSGYCVECTTTAHCPGTRYVCDPATDLCEDGEFDPSIPKIGMFYHTWHCPSAADPHDITKILGGQESWPPWPEQPFPPTSFWWGEPEDGYYCLTGNTTLLTKHAELLRDMGVDFVFVDVTNHPYNTSSLCDRPEEMIIEPFTTMVEVWAGVDGAPRIVPWVPVTAATSSDTGNYMVFTLLDILDAHPGLQFVYQGKPLVLLTENDQWPVDTAVETSLAASYTVRRMWAFEQEGTSKWSYIERCGASPLEGEPCFQRISENGGLAEQFPIALAYGADYMSHLGTATPKHQGRTFRKQFETLFNNPEIPVALITGWNEWVVGRQPCDLVPLCPCSDAQNSNGCFLDQYTVEYNRDIEPNGTELGDYYYQLAAACIELFRAGGRCDAAHAGHLCCMDYQE